MLPESRWRELLYRESPTRSMRLHFWRGGTTRQADQPNGTIDHGFLRNDFRGATLVWKPDPSAFLQYVTLLADRVPSFESYPFSIPAIRHLDQLPLHPKVTYFVGENGTGKSTLLEAIAVVEGFNPEGGSRHFNFTTRDTHSTLGQCLRLGRGIRRLKDADGFFLRAEGFYNTATYIDRIADPAYLERHFGGIAPHERSHGESFFSLLLDRFRGNGLYLFDEPESALSPMRQMSLLAIMHELIGSGSQFLIATHSPIVMAYPDAAIYHFSAAGIQPIAYTETENYKVTKAFLGRHEQMIAELFDMRGMQPAD